MSRASLVRPEPTLIAAKEMTRDDSPTIPGNIDLTFGVAEFS